jgi:hypothetical protein
VGEIVGCLVPVGIVEVDDVDRVDAGVEKLQVVVVDRR